MKRMIWLLFMAIALGLLTCSGNAGAAENGFKTVGLRGGLSATATKSDMFFHQYELTTVYALPYEWRGASGWGAAALVDGAIGIMHSRQHDTFIVSFGPDFAFGKAASPLELELGINLSFINEPSFGHEEFGGDAHFISHVGLNYRFWKDLGIGYRFQHMSNAGIYGGHNPGINLHMVELNYYLGR